jgi:hypothetical protein
MFRGRFGDVASSGGWMRMNRRAIMETDPGNSPGDRGIPKAIRSLLGRAGRLAGFACAMLAAPAFAQYPAGNYQYMPFPTAHPYAGQPQGYQQAEVPPELLPPDRGGLYDFDSRIDLIIGETVRNSYLRLEYLSWSIKQPGSHLLGAPLAGIDNPRDPFLLQTPTGSLAVGEVLDMQTVNLQQNNGIKGTIGIPFEDATLEASFWGLQRAYTQVNDPAFLRDNNALTPRFIAVSLLSDGQPGDRVLLFDGSFNAKFNANAWGSEFNLYFNQKTPRLGLTLQPLLGFRFLNYDEQLRMTGAFDNSSGAIANTGILADPVISKIGSATTNNIYSLQAGFRSEFRHQWFTLGVEPKLAFGANSYTAHVKTDNLRDFNDPNDPNNPFNTDDPATSSSAGRTLFSPTLDLGAFAKIHLTEWAHLRVGYNFMLTGNVVRADRAIYYNDQGSQNPPAVKAQEKSSTFWMQGLTVGAEILFPK